MQSFPSWNFESRSLYQEDNLYKFTKIVFAENKAPCIQFVYCQAFIKEQNRRFKWEKEISFSYLSSWFCIIHLILDDFVDLVDTRHCDQCVYMCLVIPFHSKALGKLYLLSGCFPYTLWHNSFSSFPLFFCILDRWIDNHNIK